MALAANVDIPTNLGIRAAPSEQRAELSHKNPNQHPLPGHHLTLPLGLSQ